MSQQKVITQNDALKSFIEELKGAPFIALDTEFHREKTYFPELCLIQIATPQVAAAIDPLAPELDLAPLMEFLQNSTQPKIFHAGRQDLEIFWRLTGKTLSPVFDTQIACLALGYGEQLSYANFIERVLGKRVSKAQQLTNWKARPLTEKQIKYALDDVIYLRAAYPKIHAQLRAKNRLTWLEEEEARLTEGFVPSVTSLMKGFRLKNASARAYTTLEKLALWRDNTAQMEDKPRHHIIKDDGLLILAQHLPQTIEEAQGLRMVPQPFLKRYGHDVLALIKEVATLPEEALTIPKKPIRVKNTTDSLITKLAQLLIAFYAEKEGITPKLIGNSAEIENFINGRESTLSTGWRYTLIGTKIEDLIAGKISLKVQGNQLVITE